MDVETEERVHAAVLVRPAKQRRKDRRDQDRAARRAIAEGQRSQQEPRRLSAEAAKLERALAEYLPSTGDYGPDQLRTPGKLRLPQHQDTTAALGGAYPFLAEGGLGADGVFIGSDMFGGASFVYDPWVLYQAGIITAPNIVLAGIVGSGKSSLAKSMYTRSIPFGRRVYVPGDPKGEHTAVAEAVGGKAIQLGHGRRTRLNPLDEGYRPGHLTDAEWKAQVTARRRDLIGALAETVLDRSMTPLEHTAIDVALGRAVASVSVPILPMVVDRILAPDLDDDPDGRLAEDSRQVGHA
ncbi:MAG: type IV secretory system conjugative DNA transfer family protein, partial [Bifidobacteriaceae bacterium]|nr:type IV secretory system conjugative DNA transfer family protein [Bifidobacteriaceae bacterium]